MKRKQWKEGGNLLWFVFGPTDNIWLSTASFTKRGAIQHWLSQTSRFEESDWPYWYRRGHRVKQAKIRYQPQ